MSNEYDELNDFSSATDHNTGARRAKTARAVAGKERYEKVHGEIMDHIDHMVETARDAAKSKGGDAGDIWNAMAAALEFTRQPVQPAVELNAPPQAIGDDVIDAQVEDLERELHSSREEITRLKTAAETASNYLAERDAANDKVTRLTAELAEANKKVADLTKERDEANNKVTQAEENLRRLQQAKSAKPTPPQNGAPTGDAAAAAPAQPAAATTPQPANPPTQVMPAQQQQTQSKPKRRGPMSWKPGHNTKKNN